GISTKARHALWKRSSASSRTELTPHPTRVTRAALYEEARRLGISGRSRMSRTELETAIASARPSKHSSDVLARLNERRVAAVGFLLALSPANARASDVHLRK